ncbi:MAG: polynucleotide adenylyltransferase PcnB, partial [Planctomycetes bacterium]|nr:polynucleotide adenylyltransferase PcnB [Planctomycetota bacterium]
MNVTTPFESAGTIGGNGNFPFHAAARPLSPPLDAGRFLSAEPRVRIREEHNISRRDIDPDALKILYRLARNNYIAYLVGGGVRDLLLGRNPKDFDISTDAKPEQIRALFRNSILIGRRFRLAHIRYGEKVIETSTFRRTPECAADPSNPEADLFQRDDNLFGTPQEDALRRDFTVNGLFYDIETFSVIDYVDGLEDLAARRIRAIGDPCIRFREDPVRMIRAVRFASRLDFDLDADTGEAIRRHRDELAKASSARLLEEITRLFAFSAGEKAVRLLRTTGLLEVVLPEMTKTLENHEARDRLWKYLSALDRGDTVLPDATPALIFAALLLEPLKRHLNRDWLAEDFSKLKYERVHSFLAPISLRLKLPRRLADRIVHIYLAQHRLANPGGKSGAITGFVTQDSFHESLALAEILRAAEGCSQAPLNQWRDMLAERIYGREEETGRGRRRNAGGADNGKEETAAPDGQPGEPGMSRSARRRRNRKLRRMQDREIPAVVKADANGPSAAAGEDTESLTEPAGSETVPALTPVT